MKLERLTVEFPWERTFEVLCREAPAREAPSPERAQELIEQQRESQVSVLSRVMDSPLLETDYAETSDSPERSERPRDAPFQLRDPRQTSRLFLGVAAQAGTVLRPFGALLLDELDPADAMLGRLLVVLSITDSSSPSRAEHADEWPEILRRGAHAGQALPFGPVLTPMLVAAGPEFAGAYGIDPESPWELAGRLEATHRSEKLAPWISRLLREGATRLAALSEGRLPGPTPNRHRGAHSRDIVLVGSRERGEYFLAALKSIHGVEAQTRFIVESTPGLSRIRAWSAEPLDADRLYAMAEALDVKIESLTDDTDV